MFEAQMDTADMWKRILDALKDIVTVGNLECSPAGIQLQAMDTSHISLVSLLLRSEGFKTYNCARNVNLGVNFVNMGKILKCANKDDSLTLRFDPSASADSLSFQVESSGQEKVSEFVMKLMEIDGESLGIPSHQYNSVVSMPSADFTKLCKDMLTFGENVQISVTADSIHFMTSGDIGTGSTTVKPTIAADLRAGVKKEDPSQVVDTKNASADVAGKSVIMETREETSQNFALKHLVNFTKAGVLADRVKISISAEEPLQVEYRIGTFGYMRFYLAPKVEGEEDGAAAT